MQSEIQTFITTAEISHFTRKSVRTTTNHLQRAGIVPDGCVLFGISQVPIFRADRLTSILDTIAPDRQRIVPDAAREAVHPADRAIIG